MTKRRRRLLLTITVLVVLLGVLGVVLTNYLATRKLGIEVKFNQADTISAPQYLFSFSGPKTDQMVHPLGVAVDGSRLYVTDSQRGVVQAYNLSGRLIRTFGKGKLQTPLYLARNPKDGNLYVSDRRLRQVLVFTTDGTFVRVFDPKLPKNQLPKFKTNGEQWEPLALAFASDGTMYATDILNGHRLLIFGPDGKFKRSVGTAGLVTKAGEGPNLFQFPNAVHVQGSEVWVSDSNNRRIQVFDRNGNFKKIVVTSGLPRGFTFLPRPRGASESFKDRFVVIDVLANDASIIDTTGERLLTFGARGHLEAQFSYPNDVAADSRSRLYVADSSNARIVVWGWPELARPIPVPETPNQWALCFSPLLLLPLLLLTRKRTFFATGDFVEAMIAAEMVHTMPKSRRRWVVLAADYERFRGVTQDAIALADLLNEVEFSESDARALAERFELDSERAATMAAAQRAKHFCTESDELRRLAKVLEIDVMNRDEYLDRFADGNKSAGSDAGAA